MRLLLLLVSLAAADATRCDNLLPGLKKMRKGIDLKNFDLHGVVDAGWEYPVVDYTCDQGRTKEFAGDTFQVPDQIKQVEKLNIGWDLVTAEVIKNMSDVTSSFAVDVSVQGKYGAVSGSATSSYKEMKREIEQNEQFITRTQSSEHSMKARMVHFTTMELSPELKHDIEGLPNRPTYGEFIEKYGTHYITVATFGGMFRTESFMSNKFLKTHEEKKIAAAATLSYKSLAASADVSVKMSHEQQQDKEEFESNSRTEKRYFGGDVNLADDGAVDKWKDTVEMNPEIMQVELAAIYELIDDQGKREQMEEAVKNHMKVDGGWTDWTEWTCDKTSSSNYSAHGTASRKRACEDPVPVNGGAKCSGKALESGGDCRAECDSDWIQYNNECFKYFHTRKTYSLAVQECAKRDAKVSGAENLGMNQLLNHFNKFMWIGASDKHTEGIWMWEDTGYAMTYDNWWPGEPNGKEKENCAQLWGSDGQWKDYACTKTREFTCRKPATINKMDKPKISCSEKDGWKEYNGDCYKAFNNKKKYHEAKSACASHGAMITRADSPGLTKFLMDNFKKTKKFWINLSDSAVEGKFKWMDNHEPVENIWKNWKSGEPNNHWGSGGEDCVQIRDSDGKWQDKNCNCRDPYICVKYRW